MKKVVVGLVALFGLISCGNGVQIEDQSAGVQKIVAEGEKIQVTTSIVPLASIANYIGGENVEVNNLVGVGVSPHNFSLTPQNVIGIQKSDIVFLLGIQDIDGFLFKSLSGVKSTALDVGLKVLDATSEHDHSEHAGEDEGEHDEDHSEEEHSEENHEEHEGEHSDEEHHDEDGHSEEEHANELLHKGGYEEEVNEYQYIIDAQEKVANGEHEHGTSDEHNEEAHGEDEHEKEESVSEYLEEEGEGHIHAEASIDPHVWTGKVNALIIAKKIQEELTRLQPSQKAVFTDNYNRFEQEITKIFSDFETLVESKEQKEFIVFHDAYNYLLFDAGIDTDKKIVFRSNVMSEPGSAVMKELIDEVTLHGISEFYIEPQFESKSLELLAKENNAQIFELDPLGSSETSEGFLSTIKTNLQALSNIYE